MTTFFREVMLQSETYYGCDFCAKTFRRRRSAIAHWKKHLGQEPFVCDVCGKRFVRSRYLTVHRRKHDAVKPSKSGTCKEVDSDKQCSRNDDGLTIKCDTCQRMFKTETGLFRHQVVHNPIPNKVILKPYTCIACGRQFAYKRVADLHCQLHDKFFSCFVCSKSFTTKGSLKAHMRIHKPVYYDCEACGNKFISELALSDHKKKIHDPPEIPCAMCEKKFTSEDALQLHTEVHHTAKPHVCDICGKEFIGKENFHDHLLVHQNKLFICDICGEKFNHNLAAFKHRLIHNRQNPDSPDGDDIPKKAFKPVNSTAIPNPVKTIDKPYKCDMCGKRFINKCVLDFHILNHPKMGVIASDISNLQNDSQPIENTMSYEEHDSEDISDVQDMLITPKSYNEPIKLSQKGNASARHICGMCGRTFSSGNEVWKHLRQHNKELNILLTDISSQEDHNDLHVTQNTCESNQIFKHSPKMNTNAPKDSSFMLVTDISSVPQNGSDLPIKQNNNASSNAVKSSPKAITKLPPSTSKDAQEMFVTDISSAQIISDGLQVHSDELQVKTTSASSMHICGFCGTQFTTKDQVLDHLKSHEATGRVSKTSIGLLSDNCHKPVSLEDKVQNHLKSQNAVSKSSVGQLSDNHKLMSLEDKLLDPLRSHSSVTKVSKTSVGLLLDSLYKPMSLEDKVLNHLRSQNAVTKVSKTKVGLLSDNVHLEVQPNHVLCEPQMHLKQEDNQMQPKYETVSVPVSITLHIPSTNQIQNHIKQEIMDSEDCGVKPMQEDIASKLFHNAPKAPKENSFKTEPSVNFHSQLQMQSDKIESHSETINSSECLLTHIKQEIDSDDENFQVDVCKNYCMFDVHKYMEERFED